MVAFPKVSVVVLGVAMLAISSPTMAQSKQGNAPVEELTPGLPIPGQFIVVFKDSVQNPGAVASELARAHGLAVRSVYSNALKGFAAKVPEGRLNALRNDPRVKYIEADQTVKANAQSVPTGISRIFATGNAKTTINGSDDLRIDVDVAVIDTGIASHPDLNTASGRMADCVSGICANGSATDGNGHGTHVAGTIAAIDDSAGVVGVVPGARLWGVRVLDNNGSGSMSGVIAGVDWVTARASSIEVANMSLGGGLSTALCDAITRSTTAGVVHVVAAGNSAVDISGTSPANCTNAIAVSALADYNGAAGGGAPSTCRAGTDDTNASFSNYSASASRPLIAAPGVCILSTWLNSGFNTISGTSMASPHVAGAAALLRASGVSAANVRSTLYSESNLNWTDNSPDGIKEPLLDVSDANVFNPLTVAGVGNDTVAPTGVAVLSPSASATVSGTSVAVQISATDDKTAAANLNVTWSVGGGAERSASWNGSQYVATWDTTKEANGTYTVTARAVDLAGNATTSSAVSVTVSNLISATRTVGLRNQVVGCSATRSDLLISTTMIDSVTRAAVANATVSADFSNITRGGLWRGSAVTNSSGVATFRLRNAPSGTYTTNLTGVTSTLTWDQKDPTNSCLK